MKARRVCSPGKVSGPQDAQKECPFQTHRFPPLTGSTRRTRALAMGRQWDCCVHRAEENRDNILGFRKRPLNQFSHDIILPGCGTVTLGGSRTLAKGMFPDVMLSNRTRPERQAGTGLHQGKPWVKTQHGLSPWQGTATGFPGTSAPQYLSPKKRATKGLAPSRG